MNPTAERNPPSSLRHRLLRILRIEQIPRVPLTIVLATIIGILGGYGAVVFTHLIEFFSHNTSEWLTELSLENRRYLALLALSPAVGMLIVAWMTRRFAPEAEGHGVPEVIKAVARNDGRIRPRVSLVKILASGICIGTGGSVGREGPIVQIGASLGSVAGQMFQLPPKFIKVLVAAGAAAGISATFNAPIAGVIFASEIILGSFAVESLTPIVVASVVADVVQQHSGEHRLSAAFPQLDYEFAGAFERLPSYVVLGLLCGIVAVGFTKLLYASEDLAKKWFPSWWLRALVLGLAVGVIGVSVPRVPPVLSAADQAKPLQGQPVPPLFGVGYGAVAHALHLAVPESAGSEDPQDVRLNRESFVPELWWLLPLLLLKPFMTSLTLAGGGSGGIFAPSLFMGATTGAAFGLLCNLLMPEWSASPGAYAIVGMGAVVAGTTHGILSAILIVYEMTDNYQIILPIMAAAGLASIVSSFIEPLSIYYLKLARRGESIARGHDMHHLEHIMVRDVMIRTFPSVHNYDSGDVIIRVARANSHLECLPVMDEHERLVGIIRPEDLHRLLDTDVAPHLINAEDVALSTPLSLQPDQNLLEALRDFGVLDVDVLPVESGTESNKRLIGLLLRSDVMRRYRLEMLHRSH